MVNTGAWGWYSVGNVTFTAPSTWFQNGLGMYVSGDLGYWDLGTSDAFYGLTKYTSYANWDARRGLYLESAYARPALLRHQLEQVGM